MCTCFSNPEMPCGFSILMSLIQQAIQLQLFLAHLREIQLNSNFEKFPRAAGIVPKNKVQCCYKILFKKKVSTVLLLRKKIYIYINWHSKLVFPNQYNTLLAEPSNTACSHRKFKNINEVQVSATVLFCLGYSNVWILPAASYLFSIVACGPTEF